MIRSYDLSQMVVVRSDLGDGGWSIHVRRTDVDEVEDPAGAWPIVASGPSDAERTKDGDWIGWTRPDEEDWRAAREHAAALAAQR